MRTVLPTWLTQYQRLLQQTIQLWTALSHQMYQFCEKQECGIIALKAHFLNKVDTVMDSCAAPRESEIH